MEVVGSERSDISKSLDDYSFAFWGFLAMEAHHILPIIYFEHSFDS